MMIRNENLTSAILGDGGGGGKVFALQTKLSDVSNKHAGSASEQSWPSQYAYTRTKMLFSTTHRPSRCFLLLLEIS
jgi:hypothetical protein